MACEKGPMSGHKVTGVRFRLIDGQNHAVDSSDLAFQQAAEGAMADVSSFGGFTRVKYGAHPLSQCSIRTPTATLEVQISLCKYTRRVHGSLATLSFQFSLHGFGSPWYG